MAKDEPKTDTLTPFERAQLDEMKRHHAAIEAAASAPTEVLDASPDAQFNAMVRAKKGLDNPLVPKLPEPTTVYGCRSPKSDCTFDAVIDHLGHVRELANYEWTARHKIKIDDGGLVPNPFSMNEPHNTRYKHWCWEFRRNDINEFVGHPLPEHIAAKATGKRSEVA